ncbi:MAG: hypothetical protein IPH00_17630 [Flavobacteriales bacterium]|nr:hypothetical protein [Flavobacteriales bacterium]
MLEAQIRQRQELIDTMNSEVFRIDQEIQDTRDSIRTLETDRRTSRRNMDGWCSSPT